jgi:cellulose synthase (UDP-forming)
MKEQFINLFYNNLAVRWIVGISVLLILYILVTPHYNIETQIFIGYGSALILFGAMFVKKLPEEVILFIKLLAVVVVLRYLYWRTFHSLVYDGFFDFISALLLYLAEFIAIGIYLLGVFTSMHILKRQTIDLKEYKEEEYLSVDVFIPTYNEPFDMLEKTALAALAFDYPQDKFTIHILDDGGTDQKCNDKNPEKAKEARARRAHFQEFCRKTGANYVTRAKNEHAKAGNMNSALSVAHHDLLLILDADHIPAPQFLQRTVGWFLKDPKMFLVQTPHAFYNADPIERNLQMFGTSISENDMFYRYILLGHDFWESAFFCGSAAVLRRSCIDELGGIAGETITEDAETAIKLHDRGYKSAYINEPMVRGVQADDFASLVLQRIRWTQGMVQIFILKNSFMSKGLSWYQMLSYFSATFFWFFAISRVIFYMAPLMYMFLGLKIYSANDMEMVAYVIPHILMAVMMSYFLYAKVRNPFFSEIYETVLSIFTLPAIFQTMWSPRNPTFEVTPKDVDITETYVSEFAIPFVIMLTLVGLGFVAAAIRLVLYPEEASIILMTSFWNFLNFLLLITAVAVTSEKGDVRRYIRIPLNQQCTILVDGKHYSGKITDISEGGASIEPDRNDDNEHLLQNAKEITIELLDVSGKTFGIPATFLRSYRWGSTLIFVFKDVNDNIPVRQKLIQIIYGNTTAWQEFENQHKIMNPIQSFVYIMKQSFKNAMMKEAYALTYHYFKNLILRKGKTT